MEQSYDVAVLRDGIEQLEGQLVQSGRPPTIGDRLEWPMEPTEPEGERAPHEIVELQPASEHRDPVIVIERLA